MKRAEAAEALTKQVTELLNRAEAGGLLDGGTWFDLKISVAVELCADLEGENGFTVLVERVDREQL